MLDSVKEVLTKEVDVKGILTKEVDVKGILTKEVNVKEFLEMEIELTKLKKLLATEIKLKEFLVQEIDLTKLLSNNPVITSEEDESVVKDKKDVEAISEEDSTEQIEKPSSSPEIIQQKQKLPAFDYTLLDTLHDENKKNRFVFNELMRFAVNKDYPKVAGRLDIFSSQIREHYQKADAELYAYLKTYIKIKYPKREKAFTQLSLEMKNISIEIFYTISQSPNIPLTKETHSAFMKEFINVGKLLNERIHREESVLFKMYEKTKTLKSIS